MNSAIETTLLNNIKTVLSDFPEYWNEDTLLKNKVIDDLRNYDEAVITALLSNEKIKETYALPVGDMTIFKVDEFIEMLRYKNYWDNSYTKYRNEIGLTTDVKYLNYNTDVVLDFPFKDCVLEGGMSNEDEGKKEVYYHNVIAKEEIDTLLSPKVLTNIKKYDKDGEHDINEFNNDDNLILKGNNLLALHSLKERYAGKIKMIYIDPPYFFLENKKNDTFEYNSNFKLSTWLTFMQNRIQAAYDLLNADGSLWISIDDDGVHYLKVLCDKIFGAHNFVGNIIWEKKFSPQNDATWLSDNHDHILVYAKNKNIWRPNLLPRTKEMDSRYKNPDNDPRGPWTSGDLSVRTYSKNYDFPITTPSGKIVIPPESRSWVMDKNSMNKLIEENRVWFGENGDNVPRLKRFLSDVKQGITPTTIWRHSDVGHNQEAKQELKKHKLTGSFSTPKPERLIQRILHVGSNNNDIVLDFFMGSSTTQAVAMKMNRQFIGIEQMDYINTVSVPRLQKVIDGEQGGISKDVDWQGGGSFIYAELDSLNQQYIDRLNEINSEEELEAILEEMKASAYLNFKVELHKVTVEDEDFSSFTLDKKKKVLIDVLDMNQLYLNYSEIDDTQYNISEEVKQFNHSFYNQGGA